MKVYSKLLEWKFYFTPRKFVSLKMTTKKKKLETKSENHFIFLLPCKQFVLLLVDCSLLSSFFSRIHRKYLHFMNILRFFNYFSSIHTPRLSSTHSPSLTLCVRIAILFSISRSHHFHISLRGIFPDFLMCGNACNARIYCQSTFGRFVYTCELFAQMPYSVHTKIFYLTIIT